VVEVDLRTTNREFQQAIAEYLRGSNSPEAIEKSGGK
jgi:hypothetical protein